MARRAERVRWRSLPHHIEPGVWPGALIFVAYTIYGLGMLLQADRFSRTPAYGTLTQVLDIRWWGVLHLVVAALFAGYTVVVSGRLYGIVTHIVGLLVTSIWLLAFLIRWVTDANTTVVNVASWLVLVLLMARSATLIPPVGPVREAR